jgi:hypothetical protein
VVYDDGVVLVVADLIVNGVMTNYLIFLIFGGFYGFYFPLVNEFKLDN